MPNETSDEQIPKPFNPWKRRRARRLALQALYQWKMADTEVSILEKQFEEDTSHKKVDEAYFSVLVRGVIFNVDALDALFEPFLDRKLSQLGAVEISVLRMVAFEMRDRLDVPYKTVIDEGVELARSFGAEDSFKYINGVADKMADGLRKLEKQHQPG